MSNGTKTCRECGCSEFEPCINPLSGETCHWIEPDLCSFCALGDADLLDAADFEEFDDE